MNNQEHQENAAGFDAQEKMLSEPPEQIQLAPSEQGEEISPEKPSRGRQLLNTALRWTVGIGIVFGLGVMVAWLTMARPQAQEIRVLQGDLDAARDEVQSLEKEIERLRPLEEENASLNEKLVKAERDVNLTKTMVDLVSAQLGLAEDDLLAVKAALVETDDRLESLRVGLSGEIAQAVVEMSDRLQLVLDELGDDTFAAERDLEVLINDLVTLQKVLTAE